MTLLAALRSLIFMIVFYSLTVPIVLMLIGGRVAAIGSELLGSIALPEYAWVVLAMLPLAGTALALLVARVTILRALGRLL